MAKDGTLQIKILGDSKDFRRSLKKARGSLADFAKGAAGVFAVAGVAAGAAFAKTFGEAMEQDRLNDRLAAQLNLTEEQSERTGKLAGEIYADAYGDSFGQVADTIGQVMSTFGDVGDARLRDMTQSALNLAAAFDTDVAETINAAGVMLRQGLAKDAEEAFDLMTDAFQRVPAAMRDELPQIIEEYSQDFATFGITGEDAFELIIEAAGDGRIELDKTGDAIKELSIRATDGSAATTEAFDKIGLDAGEMGNRILAGGDVALGAFDDIVEGLLAIEDPSERAQTAIALFGTPLEDLSVQEIPEFLERLSDIGDSMDTVTQSNVPDVLQSLEGFGRGMDDGVSATERLDQALNDNVSTKLTELKRGAMQSFINFVHENFMDEIDSLIEAFEEDGLGGAIDRAIELWEDAQPRINAWWTGTFMPWWESEAMPVMEEIGEALGAALMEGLVASFQAAMPSITDWINTWWEGVTEGNFNPFTGRSGTPGEFGVPFPQPASTSRRSSSVPAGIIGLSQGGIVKARPGGIFANIGEGGQDEAVIPLPKGSGGRLMGGDTYNVTINASGDGRDTVREFGDWMWMRGRLAS